MTASRRRIGRWLIAVVSVMIGGTAANRNLTAGSARIEADAPGDAKRMDQWWNDLQEKEADATRALLKFSARPDDAVTFLKGKLKPLTITAEQVNALLQKLGSEDETVWKPAFEELEYFDPRLAIDLETLMAKVTEGPARQRMVEILSGRPVGSLEDRVIHLRTVGANGDGFNFYSEGEGGGSWWAEHVVARINHNPYGSRKVKWTRAVRAMVLLEHIGTPDAVAILKEMATGHPSAQLTKAAQESLDRMAGKVH